MSTNDASSWVSDREVIPTPEQLRWLGQLGAVDGEFDGGSAAPQLSNELRSRRSRRVIRRVLRCIRYRLPRLRAVVAKSVRFSGRVMYQLLRRLPSRGPQEDILIAGKPTRVLNISDPGFDELLAKTHTEFVVLVRSRSSASRRDVQKFAAAIQSFGETDLWYADSMSPQGFRIYRPAPSHLLTEQTDWLGALIVVRTVTAQDLRRSMTSGSELDFVQQLALSIPEENWVHVPIAVGCAAFSLRPTRYPLATRASVNETAISIIIPTRGTAGDVAGVDRVFVVDAVRSIISRTNYLNYNFVIVADDPTPQVVIDELERIGGERLIFVRWSKLFNFSEKMNLGAAIAPSELLLMLNDDVEVASQGWLGAMAALLERDEFDVAGALLFFEDLTLQHAGHLYRGGAGHVGFGRALTPRDPNTYLHLDREVSGVTGACLMLTKELFAKVGGFSNQFPGNYNDVDLCLKVRSIGGRIACSGGARLYHFESKSRDATVKPEDLQRIQSRWSSEMAADPYWTDPH